jgi:hypothetical protein
LSPRKGIEKTTAGLTPGVQSGQDLLPFSICPKKPPHLEHPFGGQALTPITPEFILNWVAVMPSQETVVLGFPWMR